MNKGERAELLAKIYLIYLRDNGEKINGIGEIKSVGFDNEEYERLDESLSVIESYDNNTLKNYGEHLKIKKAPASSKADVYINGIGYSLKFYGSALPALINHTHRNLILKVCNRINLSIENLDKAVKEYWMLRLNGKIKEDIKISDENSPFRHLKIKKDLQKLLEYFLFTGTGKGDSSNPANYLIEISEYFDQNTWKVLTPSQAIQLYIDNLTISIRNKGIPSKYSQNSTLQRDINISIWVEYIDEKFKGSLHIRG